MCAAFLVGCGTAQAPPIPATPDPAAPRLNSTTGDAATLDAEIATILAGYQSGIEVSVWVGGVEDEAWYERNADVWRASASAIKSAYMVELFDMVGRTADDAGLEMGLDQRLDIVASVVNDASHPAVVHFDDAQRAEIKSHLEFADTRQIARTMIRGDDVPNVVYNAAANVVTAALGGPERVTERLRARSPEWAAGLASRRYMLAARHVTGDNEATARGLAAVLRGIAAGNIPGIDPALYEPMREILRAGDDPELGRQYAKGGSLTSDPQVRINTGFWEKGDDVIVYVVMLERLDPGELSREESYLQLDEGLLGVTAAVVAAAATALRPQ